ncbi:MAG TPA: pilus assembly PilX N-terminal domain-containing protein [Vicinamibacterales bacterium]|nr:pilus assembly PilX N-terminal domain-containing protein [Vicinamibacterales bacterium]
MNPPKPWSRTPEADSDRGIALIVAMLIMMLLSALGLSLTMVTMTEARVAHSYSSGSESFYAADAALELAMNELAQQPDWNRVLDGSVSSSFVDPAVAFRPWPGGQGRTSTEATALVTCARTSCSRTDMDARTAGRPWGPNNPRWRLFAYGPLSAMRSGAIDSREYVAVWVGDDPQENDDDPLVDGDESRGPNPGRGVLTLLVHAYGISTARGVEATVARAGNGVRVISWREIR